MQICIGGCLRENLNKVLDVLLSVKISSLTGREK